MQEWDGVLQILLHDQLKLQMKASSSFVNMTEFSMENNLLQVEL